MQGTIKKPLSVVLMTLTLAGAASAKAGTVLLFITKSGLKIEAEVLAVQHHRLILKESAASSGISLDIDELDTIAVAKKSYLSLGCGIGAVVGAAAGAMIADKKGDEGDSAEQTSAERTSTLLRRESVYAAVGGIIGGLAGTALGGVADRLSDSGKMIVVKGSSSEEIERILKWLRSQARYKEESF